MKIKLIITILAALAFGVGSSFAADDAAKGKGDAKGKGKGKGGDPAAAFARIDSNSDKKVTLDEWKAGPGKRMIEAGKGDNVEKAFAKMAGDDGELTLEEFTKAQAERAAKGKGAKPGEPKKKKSE